MVLHERKKPVTNENEERDEREGQIYEVRRKMNKIIYTQCQEDFCSDHHCPEVYSQTTTWSDIPSRTQWQLKGEALKIALRGKMKEKVSVTIQHCLLSINNTYES